jgi:Sigma 54 modulation protein / S30EA ribosomal protein
MKIQINSDNQIVMNQELSTAVESEVERAIGRFRERLTRVEVHLSDENAAKGGTRDKRCVIETRPAGMQPVSASDNAATIEEAATGAAHKMKRLLDTAFGKIDEKR